MPATEILFLGTDAVTPAVGDDTACYLVNRTVLVDLGWNATLRMQEHGLAPTAVTHVLFTHMHHDHYLGLPQLIFWRWMIEGRKQPVEPLTIVGPAADLALVVDLAKAFLQVERFEHRPKLELRPLAPGDSYACDAFEVRTEGTIHPVQGLCYRFHDRVSGAVVAFTGDTAYHEPLIEHVRGADLLIHEATYGPQSSVSMERNHGHSGAPDAARIAQQAAVERLALVHAPPAAREAGLAAAQAIFPESFWPEPGQVVSLP